MFNEQEEVKNSSGLNAAPTTLEYLLDEPEYQSQHKKSNYGMRPPSGSGRYSPVTSQHRFNNSAAGFRMGRNRLRDLDDIME